MDTLNAVLNTLPESFCQKDQKLFPQCPKEKKEYFKKLKKISRFFYRHLKCCFDNPNWNVSTESRIYFQKRIFWKKMMIPEITIFISECSMGYVECSFDNLTWFFWQKAVNLSVKLHKTSKIQKFLQDCPMTKRKHFRQPSGNLFDKNTNVFCTVTELLIFLEMISRKKI